jgi:hypothetical protein
MAQGAFPYYVLGKHGDMPPQPRFNTGERLTAVAMVLGTIVFGITGLSMWFLRGIMPTWLYQAMVIVHDLMFIVKIVLSLFAILFTYDTIVGEKEKGTLKLALSNDVPRDRLILGKAIGGGMPLSIILGKREIMEQCSPVGRAVHSGTYNAHLSTIAAAKAFLDVISQPGFFEHLDSLERRLYPASVRYSRGVASRHGCRRSVAASEYTSGWMPSRTTR